MGMLEPGGYTDFMEEAFWTEGNRELRPEYLERDGPIMAEVVREVYGCHAAPAELTLDSIAISEGGFE
jgi:hypothetical protein